VCSGERVGHTVDLRRRDDALTESGPLASNEVMLPKVQQASDIVALDLLLTRSNATPAWAWPYRIEAQIETARGLINVEEICAASPRLESIVFGRLTSRFDRHARDDD